MKTTNQRHFLAEGSEVFRELAEGRPFYVRSDFACERGDLVIVREHDERSQSPTGRVGMFRVTWAARASDSSLPSLIPPGVVVLGLAPANVVLEERRLIPVHNEARKCEGGERAPAASEPGVAPFPMAAEAVSCSNCGVRTSLSLLNAEAPAACPLCAPLLRHPQRRRQTGESSPTASSLARMAEAWVRRTATELRVDPLYVSAVVAETLSRAVEEGTLSALPYPRLAS